MLWLIPALFSRLVVDKRCPGKHLPVNILSFESCVRIVATAQCLLCSEKEVTHNPDINDHGCESTKLFTKAGRG